MRDVEPGSDEAHVGAHEAVELDVADLVVDGVRLLPRHPVLLDSHALEPGRDRDRTDGAGVVGLYSADRDERLAALVEGVLDKVLGREMTRQR